MIRRLADSTALLLMVLGLILPVGDVDSVGVSWLVRSDAAGAALMAVTIMAWLAVVRPQGPAAVGIVPVAAVAGALGPFWIISSAIETGTESLGLWLYLLGLGWLVWRALELLSNAKPASDVLARVGKLLVPALFGLWLLYLWEMLCVGFGVPQVLLPSPSLIGQVFAANTDTLWADFQQTFLKAVVSGFVMGCGSGFLVALLIDRSPFLQRGLLPLGSMVSAIPIVGIAPIMVMWFGFDWPSKAAVIVVMTFFPMLINTLAGLQASGAMAHDLMRSYGSSYRQTLIKLRLPNALPFVFNALKINSTLALIGAIVAEFFGTPIVGMGFRISTEVGRMNVDMVWATIAVAALAGSVFYGVLSLTERTLTFWHPSYRREMS